MKLLMILGGLIGFVTGLVLGLAQGSAMPGVFWRASVGALVAGLAMRWWGRIWIRSLIDTHRQRGAAAAQSDSTPAIGSARL